MTHLYFVIKHIVISIRNHYSMLLAMNHRKVAFYTLFILSLYVNPFTTWAQLAPKYSNEFLSIGIGGRGLAMGKAMAAVTEGPNAAYWNPAGLLSIKKGGQLALMHASYFAGIANLDYAGFAASINTKNPSTLAVSIIRFGIDDIPDTRFLFTSDGRLDYSQVSSFSAADYAIWASYAKQLGGSDKWRLGVNLKVIHRNAGTFANAWGAGVDVGLQYKGEHWQWGVMGRDLTTTYNVWSVNSEELEDVFIQTGNDIPIQSTEITLPRLQVSGAYNTNLSKSISLLAAFGADITTDGERNAILSTGLISADPYAGLEVGYKDRVFIRAGSGNFQRIQDDRLDTQLSFGLGLQFKTVTIDYALSNVGEATNNLYSHVFSLSFKIQKEDE